MTPAASKPTSSLRRRLRRRGLDDRGAVVVEMAVIAPVLILMFVVMSELGMAWRTASKMSNSLRAGARAGAALPEETLADYRLIETVMAGLGPDSQNLVRIIVYNSTTADGAVPQACLNITSGGVPGMCNVYGDAVLSNLDQADFDFLGNPACGGEWDRHWCPTTRSSDPNATYLGVYVEVEHEYFTGMLPGSTLEDGSRGLLLDDHAVSRIEPKLS